jgi:hypothetical protein
MTSKFARVAIVAVTAVSVAASTAACEPKRARPPAGWVETPCLPGTNAKGPCYTVPSGPQKEKVCWTLPDGTEGCIGTEEPK